MTADESPVLSDNPAGRGEQRSDAPTRHRIPTLLAGALCLIAVVTVARVHDDYGINWDEDVQSTYAEHAWRYFATGGADRGAMSYHDTRFYGAAFELFPLALQRLLGGDLHELRHLLSGIAGLLTMLAVYRIGQLFRRPYVPIMAAAALATLPRFFGQSFVSSKDLPFACGFAWTLYATLRLIDNLGRKRATILLGCAIGATLAVRAGGLPILGLCVLAICAAAWWTGQTTPRALAPQLLIAAAIGWILMLALWPWGLDDPLNNPPNAMTVAMTFPVSYPVLFEGTVSMSDALPRHYLLEYLAITTPPAHLLLALAGIAACLRSLRHDGGAQSVLAATLLVWLLLPYMLAFVGRPNVYDGLRHVLFTLPALALMVAVGADAMWTAVASRFEAARTLATGALVVMMLSPVFALVHMHPYQTAYFNTLVGGVGGAHGRYETEYFLLAYREAMEWIARQPRPAGGRVKVLVATDDYGRLCAAHYAAPHVDISTLFKVMPGALGDSFDYYLGTSRYSMHTSYPDTPAVYTVGRDGAVFAVVRGNKRPTR